MTNKEIFEIALEQSAYDLNCKPSDFLKSENVITKSVKNEKARKYLELPFECNMVSYGNNIVAQTSDRVRGKVKDFLNNIPQEHCFETPTLYVFNSLLSEYSLKACYMGEYFLPNLNFLKELPCDCEIRVLGQADFKDLYKPCWSNALCEKRKELDVLGVGAYDGGKLVGLAGCSEDCEKMYQIGIDVLPEYRRQGIASALTSRIAVECLKLDKVPFYCAAWCNIKSVKNAIKCGFRPAWTELTVKTIDHINKITEETRNA